MKAAGYVRVSTQGQAEEGVSLDAQKAKIEAWCMANDYELTAIYEDAGISGIKSDREGLQQALDSTGKGDALVVYSLSRLTRSTKDMLHLSESLESQGIDLVSLTEKIDTTTAAGKMVFRMLAVLNEFERDQIAERTKAALSYKKAKGEKYAPVPFGYREVEGRLVEVKREANIVAEILELREQGSTLAGIADLLNTRGIEGKRGGKWYASTVSYLIKRQAA
jgi:DNA invertase Pin-like site-specific DNA recombinase